MEGAKKMDATILHGCKGKVSSANKDGVCFSGSPLRKLIVIWVVLYTVCCCVGYCCGQTATGNGRPSSRLTRSKLCEKYEQRCRCTDSMVRCSRILERSLPHLPPNTQWLYIQSSRVRSLQAHAFPNVTRLTRINIVRSRLRTIHPNAFVGLDQLEQLLLYGNNIVALEPGTFRNLPQLQRLSLRENSIRTIAAGTFQQLPNLRHMLLQQNQISRIEANAFDAVSSAKLSSLSLHDNNLTCDCSIRYILDLYHQMTKEPDTREANNGNSHLVQQDEVTRRRRLHWQCATPPKLAEKDVLSLTDREIGCTQPTASIFPVIRAVREQEVVRFYCDTTGKPKPRIYWTVNGSRIPDFTMRGSRRRHILAFSANIWIREATIRDQGVYSCIAENDAGIARASVQLVVRAKPRPPVVFIRPRAQSVLLTNMAEFRCSTKTSSNVLSISWLWKGYDIAGPGSAVRNRHVLDTNNTLRILNVHETDTGAITCVARNAHGTTQITASLTVEVPTEIQNLNVFSAMEIMNNATLAAMHLQQLPDFSHIDLGDWLNMPENRYEFTSVMTQDSTNRAHAQSAYYAIRLARMARSVIKSGRWNPTGQRSTEIDTSPVGYDESMVTERQLLTIERLVDCTIQHQARSCRNRCFSDKYRSLDGSCNNFDNPSWGAADTALNFILEPQYTDGFTTPLGDRDRLHNLQQQGLNLEQSGRKLPRPRDISTKLLSSLAIEFDSDFTQMFMQWGQFVDHDISLTELMSEEDCRAMTCEEQDANWARCLSIKSANNDPRLNHSTCIGTPRSRGMCGTGETAIFYREAKPRRVVNSITAFIDGSQIYGSSEEKSLLLRQGSNAVGRMQELQTSLTDKGIPPFAQNNDVDCPRPRRIQPGQPFPCLLAGDRRINEQLDLTAMHVIWFRQHKFLVQQLSSLNREWGDEKVFHEVRKIVGAQLQHVTYTSWLPKLLGSDNELPPYSGYNSSVNPSILSEFSTAAFRFGHAMINPIVRRLDANMQETHYGNLHLRDAFFTPSRLLHEGGVDPLIRGMLRTRNKQISPSQILSSEVTEHLFRFSTLLAEDLGSLNIQRGRDHGLPGYNEYRRVCNLPTFATFQDMEEQSDANVVEILEELYESPDDIDLWVGGLVEAPQGDARIGPLFSCLVKEQFLALRDGDRLWYEREGVFTAAQLREIKKTSLAGIFCENGDDIKLMPPDVFVHAQFPQEFANCSNLPQMNVQPWRECEECELFIGCRRRTGRTVHEEAHVIVVAEEGTQTFGVGVSDNTPLRGNLSLIYEDTVDINLPETTGNTQQRSVSDHEAAEVFLQDVQTWEQLLTRYPDSSLSQSIRVLVQQAAAAEASQGDGQRESNVKFL